jgi:hypothetical protein
LSSSRQLGLHGSSVRRSVRGSETARDALARIEAPSLRDRDLEKAAVAEGVALFGA